MQLYFRVAFLILKTGEHIPSFRDAKKIPKSGYCADCRYLATLP